MKEVGECFFKSDLFLYHSTRAKSDSPKLSLEWINQGSSADKETKLLKNDENENLNGSCSGLKVKVKNKFLPHLNLSGIPQFNINTADHT